MYRILLFYLFFAYFGAFLLVLVNSDPIRWKTFRWYSEWILTLAFVPIVSLYIIWIYYTWTGEIVQDSKKTQDIDDMTPLNDDQDDFANANESTLA